MGRSESRNGGVVLAGGLGLGVRSAWGGRRGVREGACYGG